MRLRRLVVDNFRGFEHFELDLHPSFTLLVGANGTGKTALLEAASVALGSLFLGLSESSARSILRDEVRRVVYHHQGLPDLQLQYPATVTATGELSPGTEATWTRSLGSEGGRTSRKEARSIQQWAEGLREQVQSGDPVDLPLVAYYGTQRLWRQIKDTVAKRKIGSRFDGYVDCLEPASSQHQLRAWLYSQALAAAQEGASLPHVEAIEQAVCACLEGAVQFRYDLRHDELRIRWADGRVLPFDLLSDGYRNVVAMAADLAWRAAVLNPHVGVEAPAETRGVVLIDELDLSLHPGWQRRVGPDLRRAFPKLQFVATTHSAQVLSTAEASGVRILREGGSTATPLEHASGRDSNSLLEDAFGVPERPEFEQARLGQLYALIDRDQTQEAERLWRELREVLGRHDPDVVRARAMLDLLQVGPPDLGPVVP